MCPPQRDLHGPGVLERVERLKQDLLAKVQALGRELPVNTLDELIDQLGGPECVAEVSSGAPWWPAWWGWLLGPVSCFPLQAVLSRPNLQTPSLSRPLFLSSTVCLCAFPGQALVPPQICLGPMWSGCNKKTQEDVVTMPADDPMGT